MATKKITLNELKNLVKQIVKEEKISGASFIDYDFKHASDGVIKELIISYEYIPSNATIKNDLLKIKNRFREGSQYNIFEPKIGIVYKFQYGWSHGGNVFLSLEESPRNLDRPFFDEPTKNGKAKRRIIKFDNNKISTLKEDINGMTDDEYLESNEYFVETYYNGQFGQLREMLSKFKKIDGKMKELRFYLDEMGDTKIKDWIIDNA